MRTSCSFTHSVTDSHYLSPFFDIAMGSVTELHRALESSISYYHTFVSNLSLSFELPIYKFMQVAFG
jgi:hypothetical protein